MQNDIIFLYIVLVCIIIYIYHYNKSNKNGNWGSHIPVLVTILNHTNGNILEMGSGYYSTPIIHQYASDKRKILTVESDCKWLSMFKQFETSNHEFYCNNTFKYNLTLNELLYRISPNYIDLTYEDKNYSNKKFDVAFIDHAPSLRRYKDIMQLRKNVKIFIVHDTDDTILNRIVFGHELQDLFTTFKYIYKTKNIKPETTVVSDVYDVKKLLEYYNF